MCPTVRMAKKGGAVALLCLVLVGSRVAWGQSSAPAAIAEARAHFDRGLTLLNAQNYEGALAEFERSYALNPRPSVLYNIAVTLQALHRYPEAARALERYLQEATNVQPARRAEIEQVLSQLRSLIARVNITVDPAGATVRVDGTVVGTAPLARPVEVGPGRHVIEAVVQGRPPVQEEFTIASGEERSIHLRVAPAEAQPSSTSVQPATESAPSAPSARLRVRVTPPDAVVELDGRPIAVGRVVETTAGSHSLVVRARGRATWRGIVGLEPDNQREVTVRLVEVSGLPPGFFYAGIATTAALGLAAAVTGVLTLQARAEFDRLYQDDPELNEVVRRGETLRTVTNVLLVGAGVAAVGSVVLLTQTRFAPAVSTATLALAPVSGGAWGGVRVRF